jgi:hypothetical protein
MAIQEIVSAIDAYIARLKAARDLLTSPCTPSGTRDRKPMRSEGRGKPQSIQVPVAPPSASEVAVQIVPARMPRQRRHLEKPASQTFSALGGPVPQGPVVIRSSDLARVRSGRSQAHPTVPAQQPTASRGALEELDQEAAKRLAIFWAKADTSER